MVVAYAAIVLMSIFFVRRFAPTPLTVLGILVGLVFVYFYRQQVLKEEANSPLKDELYLTEHRTRHAEPYIRFLRENEHYKKQNPKLYDTIESNMHELLSSFERIYSEEVELFNQEYGTMEGIKNTLLNNFHSLSHSTADKASMEQHTEDMEELRSIVNKTLDEALSRNNARNQREGISTRTQFHHRDGPAGNDPTFDKRFNFFQRAV